MAHIHLTAARPVSDTLSNRLTGVAAGLWQAYRGWQARRATLRMLYSLDNATLRDIGISPREIESLVYGSGDRVRSYDENWWREDRR